MKYSNETHCFYPPEIEYASLPDDLIDVSIEGYLRAANRLAGESFEVVAGEVRILPAPVLPPFVPAAVSRFQARAALYAAGHFDAVETFMAQASTPMLMRLAWQDAQTFERPSATVAALASMLGLSDADLDALFIAAAAITA